MTVGPVVRATSDGRVVVVHDSAAELGALLAAGVRSTQQDGGSVGVGLRRLTELVLASFGPVVDLDTPLVSGPALDEVLGGSTSVSVAAAAVRLGVGSRRVRTMRAARVLRPAGRGRVSAMDVAVEAARRKRA